MDAGRQMEAAAGKRQRLLSFAVAGPGQRACAPAVEICKMLRILPNHLTLCHSDKAFTLVLSVDLL